MSRSFWPRFLDYLLRAVYIHLQVAHRLWIVSRWLFPMRTFSASLVWLWLLGYWVNWWHDWNERVLCGASNISCTWDGVTLFHCESCSTLNGLTLLAEPVLIERVLDQMGCLERRLNVFVAVGVLVLLSGMRVQACKITTRRKVLDWLFLLFQFAIIWRVHWLV